ncbi:MAG: HEAT repeat domain-containing protein [Planctomycetia bacterium]|nr:HEAT repeat domain-containing protein [Planctomycetia bacterium]
MTWRRAPSLPALAGALVLGTFPVAHAAEPLPSPRAVAQALVDALSSPSVPARIAAAEALARRGPSARCALPALLDLCITGDASADTAMLAVAAIVPLGGGPWEREVAALVSTTTKADPRGARWLAAKVIGATAAELDALVTPWLTGPVPAADRFAAEVAVDVLAELADLAPLERTKDDRSPHVERDDARALLRRLALAPDRALAFRALRVLVRDTESQEEAFGRLKQTLADPDADLLGQALLELGLRGRLPATVVDGLPAMLTSPKPSIRAAAARVLGERGPHAAKHVAAIGALVKDPVPAVRVAAVTALDRIGLNAPEVPTLLDAFVDDPDLSVIAELRRVIAARDGRTGRYRALALRLARRDAEPLPDPTDDARRRETLARLPHTPDAAIGAIEAFLSDADVAVRDAAWTRLDAIPSYSPTKHVDALVARIERPTDGEVPPWGPRLLARSGRVGVDALLRLVASSRGDWVRDQYVAGLLFAPAEQLERSEVRRTLIPLYFSDAFGAHSADSPAGLTVREAVVRFEAVLGAHLDDVRDAARDIPHSSEADAARDFLARHGAEGLRRLASVLAERYVEAAWGGRVPDDVLLETRFPALQPLLTDPDPRMRAAACSLLTPDRQEQGSKPLPADVRAALEERLSDEDGRVRGIAASTLEDDEAAVSDAAIARCVPMLVDRHPAAREGAFILLADATPRLGPHVPRILAQLDVAPDDEARQSQLWMLSVVPGPPSRDVVAAWVRAVGSPSASVASAGLSAIETARPIDAESLAEALPAVEARLSDPAHRESAARALGRYGPRARRSIPALERAAAAGSKAAAIALPAVRGDTAAWVALLAEDARGGRSRAALRDLRELGPRASAALPALREALEFKKGRSPRSADFRADAEATIRALEAGGAK